MTANLNISTKSTCLQFCPTPLQRVERQPFFLSHCWKHVISFLVPERYSGLIWVLRWKRVKWKSRPISFPGPIPLPVGRSGEGDGKRRDPGNEVESRHLNCRTIWSFCSPLFFRGIFENRTLRCNYAVLVCKRERNRVTEAPPFEIGLSRTTFR